MLQWLKAKETVLLACCSWCRRKMLRPAVEVHKLQFAQAKDPALRHMLRGWWAQAKQTALLHAAVGVQAKEAALLDAAGCAGEGGCVATHAVVGVLAKEASLINAAVV
jgi:hypothetical protein